MIPRKLRIAYFLVLIIFLLQRQRTLLFQRKEKQASHNPNKSTKCATETESFLILATSTERVLKTLSDRPVAKVSLQGTLQSYWVYFSKLMTFTITF